MKKMPFKIYNALSAYQQLMTSVLHGFIRLICLTYLDNLIIVMKRHY